MLLPSHSCPCGCNMNLCTAYDWWLYVCLRYPALDQHTVNEKRVSSSKSQTMLWYNGFCCSPWLHWQWRQQFHIIVPLFSRIRLHLDASVHIHYDIDFQSLRAQYNLDWKWTMMKEHSEQDCQNSHESCRVVKFALTLKELWIKVSSKSSTRHFLFWCSLDNGGNKGFWSACRMKIRLETEQIASNLYNWVWEAATGMKKTYRHRLQWDGPVCRRRRSWIGW